MKRQNNNYQLKTKRVAIIPNHYFSSINGFLSFYNLKSISRTPILKNIAVEGFLKEDGTLTIYIKDKEAIYEIIEAKEMIQCKYGLGFMLFPGTVFFKGSFMEGFVYNELSERISTYIINGKMASFNSSNRISSIGKLKKIEDILHLDSSLTFTYKNSSKSKLKKQTTTNFLGIEISMQFKKEAA